MLKILRLLVLQKWLLRLIIWNQIEKCGHHDNCSASCEKYFKYRNIGIGKRKTHHDCLYRRFWWCQEKTHQTNWTLGHCLQCPKKFSSCWKSSKKSRQMPQTNPWSLSTSPHVDTQAPAWKHPNWSHQIYADESRISSRTVMATFECFVVLLKG